MALISYFDIQDDRISDFINSPESGMGFQLANVDFDNFMFGEKPRQVIISNSDFILEFENFNNVPLLLDLDKFKSNKKAYFQYSKLSILTNSRYITPRKQFSNQENPPYIYYSEPGEEFVRLSAFKNDKRIGEDGSVAGGTYATTPNDMNVTPSGLAAVGRYALPNRLPAKYVFKITPPPFTPIYFGTVTPNYGLCGGGVEVFFPNPLPRGSAKFIKEIPVK